MCEICEFFGVFDNEYKCEGCNTPTHRFETRCRNDTHIVCDICWNYCNICDVIGPISPEEITCIHYTCDCYTKIPEELSYVSYIKNDGSNIEEIPATLVDLHTAILWDSKIKRIQRTWTDLCTLIISRTIIDYIPSELTNLETLICDSTLISHIPYGLKKLTCLECNKTLVPYENLHGYYNHYKKIKIVLCLKMKKYKMFDVNLIEMILHY